MSALGTWWKELSKGWKVAFGAAAIAIVAVATLIWWLVPPDALSFAGGRTVALSDYTGPSPSGVPGALRDASAIERGRYLAHIAGCETCHTIDGGARFGGSRAFATAFGTLYSPNITADAETGIGRWTDADFLRAIHEGVAKDGTHLYPAFPFESYTLMSDADALAIKAYLFSLPAARQVAPANSLRFPFNQRWLMAIWAGLYSPDERFRPHTDRSAAWNRGAYLVEALAHCNDCHTGRNLLQAPDNHNKFGGGESDGWRAYNITQDRAAGIGGWSDLQIAQFLAYGHADQRGSAGGPMADVVDAELSHAERSDIAAIVTYLRSIPPMSSGGLPAPRLTPAAELSGTVDTGDNLRGRHIFEGACASCHNWSGVSLLTDYATLTGSRAVNDPTATNVAAIVLSGVERKTPNGKVMMPSFGHAYSDTEIAAVANYVTARFGAEGSHLTADDVAKLRQ